MSKDKYPSIFSPQMETIKAGLSKRITWPLHCVNHGCFRLLLQGFQQHVCINTLPFFEDKLF